MSADSKQICTTEGKAEFNASNGKAALILQAIVQATGVADEDCGDVEKSSCWLILIEAAANHAHYLLTGSNLVEVSHE